MNMGGSLACAMWLVGNDLGDQRLMDYAEEQIINGIAPHQLDNGYFPYNIRHKYRLVDGIALDSNYYHTLTLQVLSSLLAYETPENDYKQSTTHPKPDVWNWEYGDAWIKKCAEQKQTLRLHGPISPHRPVDRWWGENGPRISSLEPRRGMPAGAGRSICGIFLPRKVKKSGDAWPSRPWVYRA